MRERIPGLDLLRALAIAMVMLNHSWPLLTLVRPVSAFWWLEGGAMGVDLFFVLSGFLIGQILLETNHRLGETRILAGFLLGRWLRTLPAYYLFLLLNILVHRAFFPWPFTSWLQLTPYLWFAQNLTARTPPFFFESWSLGVEEWFYLLMPLAIWAGLRAGLGFSRSFAGFLLVLLVVPVVLRAEASAAADWHRDIANVVIYRLDAIGWGIAAALMQRMQPARWERWRGISFLLGLGLAAGCYLYVSRAVLNGSGFARVALLTLVPVGFALILPWAAQIRSLGGGWGERAIVALARWSYSLYLVNLPMSVLVYFLIERRLPQNHASALLAVLIYLVGSVAVGALCWRLVERPVFRLRGRIALCQEAVAARVQPAATG